MTNAPKKIETYRSSEFGEEVKVFFNNIWTGFFTFIDNSELQSYSAFYEMLGPANAEKRRRWVVGPLRVLRSYPFIETLQNIH